MYNISTKNLIENQSQRLEWKSSDAHRQLCTLKGKQDVDCQNFIRVYSRIDDHTILVCGTNSFKPLCRYYRNGIEMKHDDNETPKNGTTSADDTDSVSEAATINENDADALAQTDGNAVDAEPFKMINEIDGQGRCPYNPTHNSSYIFTDGQLYSATVADFSGGDALIYREVQRTEQYNAKQLNQPAFVSTVERNGYVFFFFREIALENTNCGKTIYSRVGRVCKNDHGGPPLFNYWTSYLKTRLNCSIPGDFPFYFDEIRKYCFEQSIHQHVIHVSASLPSLSTEGTTSIIDGLYEAAINRQQSIKNSEKSPSAQKPSSIIYAVFTTPQNAIPGSAVCAFRVEDIIETFEGNIHIIYILLFTRRLIFIRSIRFMYAGDFKGQKDATSNWLPIPSSDVPSPRPGKCVDDSRELPMRTVNFVKMHTLMDAAVPAVHGRPLLTRVNYRFTAITVDSQIESLSGDRYDVLFVGTDTGKVIKFINFIRTIDPDSSARNQSQPQRQLETVVITETQALPQGYPVKEMTVAKDQESLIVVGNGHIVSIKLNHCSHIFRCRDCLNLQDPYCVWDGSNHECVPITSVTPHTRNNFLQHLRQTRKDSSKTVELCKKSGDDTDNYIDPPPQVISISKVGKSLPAPPSSISITPNGVGPNENDPTKNSVASTRGTVASVGHVAPDLSGTSSSTSADGFVLTNSIDTEESGELGIVVPRNLGSQASAAASNNDGKPVTFMAHPMFASVVFIVFAVGLAIGFVLSKRLKLNHSAFGILRGSSGGSSAAHHHLSDHHRNQLNYYDKSTRGIPAGGARNSSGNGTNGKDINLLMNVMGPYIAATAGGGNNGRTSLTSSVNAGCQTPNNLNKKDIIELDFETKDRSHECKNSTEHLDIKANTINNTISNCNNAPQTVIVNTTNTGTLQKVKKTYL